MTTTPKIKAEQAALLRNAWRYTPAGFALKLQQHHWPRHLQLISWVYVLVATGHISRLTVSLPPGHAKTTGLSRVGPTWELDTWPNRKLIGAGYSGHIAVENGKAVRELIETSGRHLRVRLKGDSTAADAWQTTMGGGLVSAGVGGSITGRRAHGARADDLHKDFDSAHSATQRAQVHNWWPSVMRTRLFPGASAIISGTRWHEDDIIGWVGKNDTEGQWTHLVLPAVAEGDETIYEVLGVRTCEKLLAEGVQLFDWKRSSGAALWPETIDPETGELIRWYDEEELRLIRADLGEYMWGGLYQQHPAPPSGEMFPASMWDRADVLPPRIPLVRFWDLAATEGGRQKTRAGRTPDETVGALVARDDDGYTYIVDIVHGRWKSSDVKKVLHNTAQQDAERYGRRVKTWIEEEPGASGKSWAEELIRGPLAGFWADSDAPSGDKETRARPLASQQQAGFVKLLRVPNEDGFGPAPWFDHLIEQARVFPHGAHDDVVDACSAAFNKLLGRQKRKIRTRSAARRQLPEPPRPR